MKEKILVAVDGSNTSLEALKEAVRLAEAFQYKVIVLNVQPSFHTLHTRIFISESQLKEYQQELFSEATRAAVDFLQSNNIDYEIILKIGDASQQICQQARELAVRYIIIGSRGLGAVKGTMLGSVSHSVVHQTQIPIMIIPHKQ